MGGLDEINQPLPSKKNFKNPLTKPPEYDIIKVPKGKREQHNEQT